MCKIIIYNFYTYPKSKGAHYVFSNIVNPETIKLAANIKESTLYPILKKLEKAGYMTTYSEAYQGRKRKYYSITQEGKNQLQFLNEEWLTYKETLDGIVEGRLRHDKD